MAAWRNYYFSFDGENYSFAKEGNTKAHWWFRMNEHCDCSYQIDRILGVLETRRERSDPPAVDILLSMCSTDEIRCTVEDQLNKMAFNELMNPGWTPLPF